MVRVHVEYDGEDSSTFYGFRLDLVAGSGQVYGADCYGIAPDELPVGVTAFNGGSGEGNVCFEVDIDDIPSLLLYDGDPSPPGPFFDPL